MARPPETPNAVQADSPEQAMIRDVFAPLAVENAGACGLRDDAAVIPCGTGSGLVITKDMVVEGVHFPRGGEPGPVARRALRVNLSDLAAKGARPGGYLLGLALPDPGDRDWLERFAAGLAEDQELFGCSLAGGDTVATPGPVTVSITAFGQMGGSGIVRREGARPGDIVYVSGTIGDAALGLRLRQDRAGGWAKALDDAERTFLLDRYTLPQPRVPLADAVAQFASASMDISDGFAGDLDLLCRASGVGAEIAVDGIPLSGAARRALESDRALLDAVLCGGDDYEILCAIGPYRAGAFEAAAAARGIPVRPVGRLRDGRHVHIRDRDGQAVNPEARSYSHL